MMLSMASVEPLGLSDPGLWLVISGRLWEGDADRLLGQADAQPGGDVTVDLLGVDELDSGGCSVLRRLAEHLWEQGRLMTLVYDPMGRVARTLARSGTLDDHRMMFVPSFR
jgi:ABC-type transporter Mla MlaB component